MQPRSVHWDEAAAVASPAGDRLTRAQIGPRCARGVAALSRIAGPEVEGLPDGSSFCATEAELGLRIGQAEQLLTAFKASPHPWAAVEAEQANKLTLQRGGAPGWSFLPDGLVVTGGGDITEGMLEVEELLKAAWVQSDVTPRYKRGTQHSFPDFLTTDTSLILHTLCAAASPGFDDLAQLLEQVGGIFDEPQGLATQMYQRAGPIRKPVAIRTAGAGSVYTWGAMTSCVPRRRHIFGEPSAVNIWQLPWVSSLKTSIVNVPWLFSYGPEGAASDISALPAMVWFSDDISGFDQSVTHAHQLALYRMYGRLVGHDFGEFKIAEKDMPLIGTALDPDDAAFRYKKRGVTPSGTLTTAIDGTCINASRILMSAGAAMGVSARRARETLGRAWAFKCQGDDTLIGSRVPFDRARYEATSLALGYTTAVQDGIVFLMHHIDPERGQATALVSRVFGQTVFNEYGGEDTVVELAGLVARCSRAYQNPWFRGVFAMLMEHSALAAEFKITDYRSAVSALARPSSQERLFAIAAAKPRARGTFRNLLAPDISALVAALLPSMADSADTSAIHLTREQARADALALAHWMAVPRDERRGDAPTSVPLDDMIASVVTDRYASDDDLSFYNSHAE